MKSIRYELKYCEGCGTLKLRPIPSVTNYCRICEDILARFRFPVSARAHAASGLAAVAALKASAKIRVAVPAVAAGRQQ
jgi:hypothetical protein